MRLFDTAMAQLILARVREFYREPEAVFWVYGFPILMTVALGLAFRENPEPQHRVDVTGPGSAAVAAALAAEKTAKGEARYAVKEGDAEAVRTRLRTGRTDVVVTATPGEYAYEYVPTRPESKLARDEVNDVLQRAAGRKDPVANRSAGMNERGGRYIDFLVPGLLGMGLMGGGLWGLGFVTVDMRIRKLLKRLVATPMRKADFLASLMVSRLVFMVPEVLLLLAFAWWAFGVTVAGSVWAVVFLILLGAFSFAGLGLLIASRANTMEAVSGLMNLVMLPMYLLSGIFFSSERFPEFLQPFIRALPLTALINALRAVMLEGATLGSQWGEVLILAAWGAASFALALRLFRWQ
ncbi:MAG: ABC transporter permease [Gemmataceae bacterium]